MVEMISSPDPLNDSPTFQSLAKPRRSSRARRSLPLQGSSPKKQTFELDVGNDLSPQKIRVTVEAGNSDAENAYTYFTGVASSSPTRAPTNQRRERTTTTTIPVKGLSDSEDEASRTVTPKRGRGRPRKSGTPVPAKKNGRASTPTRRNRRKSIGDLVDGDDEDDINYQIGKGVEIGRGKGKSRSRSAKGTRNAIPAAKDSNPSSKPASSVASKKGRGRRKAAVTEEVEVLEDESCEGNGYDYRPEEIEIQGALEPIDSSSRDPPSAYSTVRSTTTLGGSEEDVVIARFDPGNETPRRPGWSSPHVIDVPQPSRSTRRARSHPSPSASPAKSTFSQYKDESLAMVPVPDSERQASFSADADHDIYEDDRYAEEDENEDEIGELREFDTILESEGFSMISVHSVPSLREHFSSPANQPEKQLLSQIKNKALLSVQEKEAPYDDSFSSIPGDVLEAATPGRKTQNPRLLSVQNTRVDDSFSSIPPEVLQDASPARKTLVSKLLSKTTGADDSFSSIAPEILEAATPHRSVRKKKPSVINLEVNDQYEDSFSAIPPAILDAATPARVRQESLSDRLNISGPRLNVSPSNVESQAPPRLLTPEETPSPPDEGSDIQKFSSIAITSSQPARQATTQGPHQDSSIMHSHLPSSPPSLAPRRYTYTAHLRQHRQLNPDTTQTPSIVFSSPALPPRIQAGRGIPALAPPEQIQRPVLSPIVRAGRMLQDILVPSSPRSRSQSLGSPFKSPATDRRSNSSAAQESYPSPVHERLAGPLPRLDLSGHFSGGSSQRSQYRSLQQQDDPFRNSALTQQRSPSPEEKQQYSLELPDQRRYSDPRLSSIRSEAKSVRSDDAMSWQAEEEISLPEHNTSMRSTGHWSESGRVSGNSTTAEQRWAAERAAVVQQVSNANSNQVIVIDSDDEHSNHDQGQNEDDEDFGLLLETLNSSSPAVERQEAPRDTLERPRRSKIPSPWRKNSKRLVYSDELTQLSYCPPETKAAMSKAFVREAASQPVTVRRIVSQESSDGIDADLSGWQIPQKSNFQPRPRETGNLDLSALLGTSPPKRLPILPGGSQQTSSQRPSSSSQPSSALSTTEQVTAEPIKQNAKEITGFTPIPQKMGFKPRARADLSSSPVKSSSLVPDLFDRPTKRDQANTDAEPRSSSPLSRPLASSSPSRTNTLSGYRTPAAQLSPSVCSQDSASFNSDKENQAHTNSRTLKWTESLRLNTTANAVLQTPLPPLTSPTKSCLRSPLKTPSAGSGSNSANLSPSKGVTFVSSSPTPTSPILAPLSATKWSKDHWRLLDTIVQTWKPENNTSPVSSDEKESSARRRRNSTRVISRLLGKNVTSGDEKMKLEQWHLEAVDEFRGCVPGWQESVVAMRVFALLVGEERRAKGLFGGGSKGNYDHLN